MRPPELSNRNHLGGMSLSYQGGMMEVVAQITIFGHGNAGSIDIPFSAAMDYRSTIQEAVWWMPRHSMATIILGNDSDVSISASLTFSSGSSQQVELAPHATETIERQVNGQQGNSPESLSIQTNGPTGSLRATGFVRTNDRKFTSGILFYDPQNVRQQHLFASNLRVKNVELHLVLKNISDSVLTARPKFLPATSAFGNPLELPSVTIAARQSIEVNLSPLTSAALTRADLESVSVQIINSGAAGSLIGALSAANEATQITYTVPLRDSGAKRNSTGGYPWKLDNDYNSIISITNVGDVPTKFIAVIGYAGGKYIPAERELTVGETAFFDLRKLRNEQIPDKDGNILPVNINSGQFHWSIVKATDTKRLIGRTEVVSPSGKVSSSFSCPVCCPDSGPYSDGFNPNPVVILVDGFVSVTGSGEYVNCYGWPTYTGVELGLHDWWCVNPAVIQMGGPGDDPNTITGMSPGQSDFDAYYDFTLYFDDGMDCYVDNFDAGMGGGGATVKPRITGSATLWWFNQENPAGYATSTTLTASPANIGSYSWVITSGTAQLRFSNNGTSETTSSNQATVKTINSSGQQNDISVKVTVNGVASDEFKFTSRTPWSLSSTGNNHYPDAERGYSSYIGYAIRDQFGITLPSDVPLNEKFPSPDVTDYAGENWGCCTAGNLLASPSGWADRLAPPPLTNNPPPHPAPIFPQSPHSNVKILHVFQEWYVGSLTIGQGRRVQTDNIQLYLDHGEHFNIVSPNP